MKIPFLSYKLAAWRREAVLSQGLVGDAGNGLWLDRGQQQCLVLWHKLDTWSDIIYEWARSSGLQDSVMTIDELSCSDEVQGTGKLLFTWVPGRVPCCMPH